LSRTSTLIIGCGYLGRRVGRLLQGRGDRAWGTARSADRADELGGWGVEAVVADVLRPASLDGLPRADRVLYCVGFDRSAGVPIRSVYVDGLGRALERVASRAGSIVYVSSTGVYGGDDGGWVDEETPPGPRTESGRACLEGEGLVRSCEAATGLRATIVRFSGLYGPGRIMRSEGLIRGEPVVGDPDKFLNLIHIDDAAAVAVAALDRGGSGELFLGSDDRPAPRREFYERAAEAMGAPPPRFRPAEPGSPEARREGSNKRVRNGRMRAVLSVALLYPDIASGVPAALGPGA